MQKLIFLFALLASMEAQTRRFPFRSGGSVPVILDPRDYYSDPGFEPSMAGLLPGQGRVNLWGHCVIQYTPIGTPALSMGNEYSLPSPDNATNRWILLIGLPAGARYMIWIGEPSVPSNTPGAACSAPVSTPMLWSVPDENISNNLFLWHPGGTNNPTDDYTLFVASHDNATGTSILWKMYCDPTIVANKCDPANAAEAAQTNWQWAVVRNFSGSDAWGPFIDRNNQAFCIQNCGTPSQVFRNSFFTRLYLVASDGDNFLFSLRESSKNEFGSCRYKISDDYVGSPNNPFRCLYLDAYGEMNNGSPPIPACTKGNGPMAPFGWATMSNAFYQMNGDDRSDYYGPTGTCRGQNLPKYYRSPWTTARVGRWVNPVSVTGSQVVAHGAPIFTGVSTLAAPDDGSAPWWGFCPAPFGLSPNYTTNVRSYYDVDGPLTGTGVQSTASKSIAMLESCQYTRGGLHFSFAAKKPRYQLLTFYEDQLFQFGSLPPKPQGVSLMLFDVTRPTLGPLPQFPTPIPYGCLVQIAQHQSCENCPGGGYHTQGHGALSMNARRAYFKSNGVRSGASGFTGYMIIMPTDPECQR